MLKPQIALTFDGGKVLASGTHRELLAKKGIYADLYNSQFESLG